jgi:hypothetical protein
VLCASVASLLRVRAQSAVTAVCGHPGGPLIALRLALISSEFAASSEYVQYLYVIVVPDRPYICSARTKEKSKIKT